MGLVEALLINMQFFDLRKYKEIKAKKTSK